MTAKQLYLLAKGSLNYLMVVPQLVLKFHQGGQVKSRWMEAHLKGVKTIS